MCTEQFTTFLLFIEVSTMSRYLIPAIQSEHRVVVGWDSPLASFFAEVTDLSLEAAIERGEYSEEEVDPMLLWVGAILGEIPTLEQLQDAVAPFAILSSDMVEQLQSDYAQPWSPSPMQHSTRQFIAQHNTSQ
jgi:hypothetical protein